MTDECIRDKCYCWLASCAALEERRMKAAKKRGDDPETARMKTCNFPNSDDTLTEEERYENATRWMKKYRGE